MSVRKNTLKRLVMTLLSGVFAFFTGCPLVGPMTSMYDVVPYNQPESYCRMISGVINTSRTSIENAKISAFHKINGEECKHKFTTSSYGRYYIRLDCFDSHKLVSEDNTVTLTVEVEGYSTRSDSFIFEKNTENKIITRNYYYE